MSERLDLLLPAFNEAEGISALLREIDGHVASRVELRLIVCEDGSTDDTRRVVSDFLSDRASFDGELLAAGERKGYARALLDGFREARSEFVLVMDGDGQCDPADFARLWEAREGADLVCGIRRERRDHLARRALSKGFRSLFRRLFDVSTEDPSCPYVLIRREAIHPLLDTLGELPFGLWWEVQAHARARDWVVRELPIHHRERSSGGTRAFSPSTLPRTALQTTEGLLRLRKTLAQRGRV